MKFTLQEIRLRLKLNQKQLGEKVGVCQKTVFNWESGERDPGFSKLKMISELSGISIDDMEFPYPNESVKMKGETQ